MKARFIYIISTVLIGISLFTAGSYTYARLVANHSDEAFDEEAPNTVDAKFFSSSTIRELIIKGAEYFFKTQADINLLSENTEVSDLYGADFFTLWLAANSAMDNLNMARFYYQELQYKADRTPYNQVVIAKLMTFDYDSFQEEQGLIKDVFSEAKSYLVKGDVRGVYKNTSNYFDSLAKTLETIKDELYVGKVPGNKHMWNLNQICAKAHMFGQYIAMLFDALK